MATHPAVTQTAKAFVDALLDADDFEIEEACAALYPDGPAAWCHKLTRGERRSHREHVLRLLLGEVGRECLRRANSQGAVS